MAHDHPHHSDSRTYGKAFAAGIGLNIAYVILELTYGLWIDSSALLADAGHNASDVLSLVFAWFAIAVARRRPSERYTYGLRRGTILVSILNALLLFGAAGVIGWEAWSKLREPAPVPGTTMMIVAGIGIVINTATALLFMRGQREDLNIKGAFLHMAADAGVSVGVVAAGLVIHATGYLWVDPVVSLLILLVIVYGTWQLFIDAINLALDATPKDIDFGEVERFLAGQSEVVNVHDLHIWAMSTTENALSVHLVVRDRKAAGDAFLQRLQQALNEQFGIQHTTIQLEGAHLDDTLKEES